MSLPASHSYFCFSPKYVNYIFFSTSSSHLYANPLSALSAASGRGRMEVCAFLLERGPGLEIPNRRGMAPLLSATKHGHTQVKSLVMGFFFFYLTSSVSFIFLPFLGIISLPLPGCGVAAKARCRYQCQRQAGSHCTDAGCLGGPYEHCGTPAVKGSESPPSPLIS